MGQRLAALKTAGQAVLVPATARGALHTYTSCNEYFILSPFAGKNPAHKTMADKPGRGMV
jgi:hypothetical protein